MVTIWRNEDCLRDDMRFVFFWWYQSFRLHEQHMVLGHHQTWWRWWYGACHRYSTEIPKYKYTNEDHAVCAARKWMIMIQWWWPLLSSHLLGDGRRGGGLDTKHAKFHSNWRNWKNDPTESAIEYEGMYFVEMSKMMKNKATLAIRGVGTTENGSETSVWNTAVSFSS